MKEAPSKKNEMAELIDEEEARAAQEAANRAVAELVPENEMRYGRFGRFGKWVAPRPGHDEKRIWAVDFDLGGGKYSTWELEEGWEVKKIFVHAISRAAESFPDGVLPKGIAPRVKAWSALLWLLMRGKFFWHEEFRTFETCMYLNHGADGARLMEVLSDEFLVFLASAAGMEDVNPQRGDMGKVMGLVKQVAMDAAYSQGIVPSAGWDRRGEAVYISSGDSEMVKVTAKGCQRVANGTDGVVFLRGKTLAEWELGVAERGLDPFDDALAFKNASYADGYGRMLVRLWVMNLFASHVTKPPLLITGGAGSGKTRLAKAIKEVLGIRQGGVLDLSVQQIEDGDKGRDAFWATVNDGKLEVFDNFDTKVDWASDAIQTAATDGQTKRRTLYTTYGVSVLRANANLILTSNNPLFTTEGNGGLADRLVTVRLEYNTRMTQDKELSEDIALKRSRYMTWMVWTVAAVLAERGEVQDIPNRRHPDWGEFSVRLGRALGCERAVVEAMGAAEAEKSLLPLQNDPVAWQVMESLKEEHYRWEGGAGEMAASIIERVDDGDEKTKAMYSARRVGKVLTKFQRQFAVFVRMAEPRILRGKSHYEFGGLTAIGESVLAKDGGGGTAPLQGADPAPRVAGNEEGGVKSASEGVAMVGMVGKNGVLPINACAHGNKKFMRMRENNPPYPPCAAPGAGEHARAGDNSLLSREEEEGEGVWDI